MSRTSNAGCSGRVPAEAGCRRKRWLASLLLAVLAGTAVAAGKPLSAYQYRVWTSDDGLPHPAVPAIAETPNGFLWFATPEGLVRFNGAQLQAVPQLRGGSLDAGVNALAVANDGALWLATRGTGVIRRQLHEDEQRWGRADGLPGEHVDAIAIDAGGRPVIRIERAILRLQDGRFLPLPGLPDLPYQRIVRARDGSLWISTRQPAVLRIGSDDRIERIDLPVPATGPITSLPGAIWIATGDGLLRRDESGDIHRFGLADGLASTLVEALLGGRDGALWIAHQGRGLQRLADGRFESFGPEHGLHHGFLRSLHEDRHGALWIGSDFGVGRLRDAPTILFDRNDGLGSDVVRTVLADPDGSIWAGTDGGGLARIRGYTVERIALDGARADGNVRSLARDADGGLWVAQYDVGLLRHHRGRWQQWQQADGLPSSRIQVLLADTDDRLWIGSQDRGLALFAAGAFERVGVGTALADADVRCLLRRRDSSLLAGTAGHGLLQMGRDGTLATLVDREALLGARVLALYEGVDGELWIGTDQGLALHDGKALRLLDEARQRAVYFIAGDGEGGLWLSGSLGATHLPDTATRQLRMGLRTDATLRSLGSADGLDGLHLIGGSQPAGAVAGDGRLWLPTSHGLAVVDPRQLPAQPSLPRVQIDSLRINGRAMDFSNPRFALAAEQNRIEIGVGSVHSLGMDRLQYQTRLDGLDRDWRPPSDDAQVLYAALAPGHYRFRGRALTGAGPGGFSEEAWLEFDIAAHWYQRPSAWLLMALVLILLPLGLFRWRQRRLLLERSQLATEVSARTAELSEALEQARQAARAKTRFLASISHELRTPLTAILGFSEQTLAAAPDALQPGLRRIHGAARLQLELIDDVLDASRIESGQLPLTPSATDPHALLQQTLALLEPVAADKGLALQLLPTWPLPAQVMVDPLRLRQILLNLTGNAIKFSAHGTIRVTLGADADAGRWWFEVVDEGIGIDPAHLQRLFRPFEQADDSTSRRFGGSGLGLYISHELAQRMGGDLRLHSSPGVGTCARVELPLPPQPQWLLAATQALGPVPVPAHELGSEPPRLQGEVLIAEDAEDVRELLAALVGATGVHIRLARDGGEALALAGRHDFDLLLLDLRMPVLDGLAVVAQLHQQGRCVPAVLLTADLLEPALDAGPPEGFVAVLPKPIDRQRLYALLSTCLAEVASGDDRPGADDPALAELETRLTSRFAARLRGEADALRDELQAGDHAAAIARLHRLKGSAPMFGHTGLGTFAGDAERTLREGVPPSREWIDALVTRIAGDARRPL